MPPPIPPRRPATAGLTPRPVVATSISDAVKSRTAPFVDASIHAYAESVSKPEYMRMNDAYPWDETLVETGDTTTTPHCLNSLKHRLLPVGRHLCLEDLKWLTERRNLNVHDKLWHDGLPCDVVDLPPTSEVSTISIYFS